MDEITPFISEVTRKTFIIRESGRSTDFISPSFGHGCIYECAYCYMKRHKPRGLDVATNTNDILSEINSHAYFATVDKPNQTHEKYITYDISCNEDFALHANRFHEWEKIFEFFKNHPIAMGSFATKFVNLKLLSYNPEGKVRIRFSLMPQFYADMLEPKTSSIEKRIKAIDAFIEAGYDVHINFSPVIVTKGWLDRYRELFNQVEQYVTHKNKVKCEVIFLTHNKNKHEANIMYERKGEHLLWNPEIQENKISQYGGTNIRYKHDLKAGFIYQFKQLHQEIIPWNTIRYIF